MQLNNQYLNYSRISDATEIVTDSDTDTNLSVATLQARMMIVLMAISHGIKSALNSARQCKERITPLPPPTMIPVGPLRFSTHPGIGSLQFPVTGKRNQFSTICVYSDIIFLCVKPSCLWMLPVFDGLDIWKTKLKKQYFSIQCFPICWRSFFFGSFPGFPLCFSSKRNMKVKKST